MLFLPYSFSRASRKQKLLKTGSSSGWLREKRTKLYFCRAFVFTLLRLLGLAAILSSLHLVLLFFRFHSTYTSALRWQFRSFVFTSNKLLYLPLSMLWFVRFPLKNFLHVYALDRLFSFHKYTYARFRSFPVGATSYPCTYACARSFFPLTQTLVITVLVFFVWLTV